MAAGLGQARAAILSGVFLAALLAGAILPLQAQDHPGTPPEQTTIHGLGGELHRFLYDEAMATLHLRSYFFDRQNGKPPNNQALATGGWVGLESGWFYDTFQIGAVGYTTQPVWAPQTRWNTSDGTSLLKPGGYGYFTLGQAYASARWKDQTFTGFRQYVDELEVNPRDDRELPQTFEAYALRGRLSEVNYFAGYVAAMKPRTSSPATAAGTMACSA